MLGAIAGDVIGSVYEWNNHKSKRFEPLFAEDAFFTDDTVHTVAVMAALMDGGDIGAYLHDYTNEYPGRGYGGSLAHWAASSAPKPYGSFGNGSAMRVSPCAWWATSEEEALALAARSAAPTHNHPEGVKGAQAVALAIWLGRGGEGSASDREEIRERLSRDFGYDLGRTVDEIRPGYRFDETCQGSVPEALVCALEAESFEDAIRNAISIGGDSDTIAAITGSVAEGLWGVPEHIQEEAMSRLDGKLAGVVRTFRETVAQRQDEGQDTEQTLVTQTSSQSVHSEQSSYREILIEHLFTGELLRTLWPRRAEVMKPQVDDGGYDLVVEVEGIVRHIQIKASGRNAKTARQNVHQRLQEKPSGCVIWVRFDQRNFDLGPFLWFGSPPGKPLPCLSDFKVARHTRGDSTGKKSERPAIRVVPKGRFERLESITEVVERLFGPR